MEKYYTNPIYRVGLGVLALVVFFLGKLWVVSGSIVLPLLAALFLAVFAAVLAIIGKRMLAQPQPIWEDAEQTAAGEKHPVAARKTAPSVLASGYYLTDFMELNRDPSIWLCIVNGLDLEESHTGYHGRALSWMLDQPDCEAAVALDIWANLNPSDFLGKSIEDGRDEDSWRLPVLKQIVARSENQGFPTGRLREGLSGPQWQNRSSALAASGKLASGAAPLLEIPERLLTMPLSGGTYRKGDWFMDDGGFCGDPSDFDMYEEFG